VLFSSLLTYYYFFSEQRSLLNPKHSDITIGALLRDSMGEGAIKKMPQRRLEAFSGNISSYSRVMNNPEHLKRAMEVNEVSMALGELRQEAEDDRKAAARQKKIGDEQREQRKQQALQLELDKKMQLQPSLLATAEKLATNESSVADINNKGLVDLLKYFFDPPTEGLSKMKRQQLMEVVEERLQIYRAHRFEA
jgi:hypothetical protein